jgi:SAM-dependent methyltransferase
MSTLTATVPTASTAPAPRRRLIPDSLRPFLTRLRHPRFLYLLFARSKPISNYAGRERGLPIDRFYIESFLDQHRSDITGHCLEVKDNAYTRQFGQNVTHSDILDINPDNKAATFHADLRSLSPIPDNTFDCFILTQTLQYIDDLDAAITHIHRILKPGGVLLATLPTLGKMEGLEPNVAGNFWRFTPHSADYLFKRHFPPQNVQVQSWGNAISGMAFYVGLSQEDLGQKRLQTHDPAFPCIVTVRAVK